MILNLKNKFQYLLLLILTFNNNINSSEALIKSPSINKRSPSINNVINSEENINPLWIIIPTICGIGILKFMTGIQTKDSIKKTEKNNSKDTDDSESESNDFDNQNSKDKDNTDKNKDNTDKNKNNTDKNKDTKDKHQDISSEELQIRNTELNNLYNEINKKKKIIPQEYKDTLKVLLDEKKKIISSNDIIKKFFEINDSYYDQFELIESIYNFEEKIQNLSKETYKNIKIVLIAFIINNYNISKTIDDMKYQQQNLFRKGLSNTKKILFCRNFQKENLSLIDPELYINLKNILTNTKTLLKTYSNLENSDNKNIYKKEIDLLTQGSLKEIFNLISVNKFNLTVNTNNNSIMELLKSIYEEYNTIYKILKNTSLLEADFNQEIILKFLSDILKF